MIMFDAEPQEARSWPGNGAHIETQEETKAPQTIQHVGVFTIVLHTGRFVKNKIKPNKVLSILGFQ